MADTVDGTGFKFPANRKREVRVQIAAAFSDDIFVLVDPDKRTKIQINKNSEEVEIATSSDTKLADDTRITEANVIANKATILFEVVDANSTTNYYSSDFGVSIVRIKPSGTPGAGAMNYNVTQDGN